MRKFKVTVIDEERGEPFPAIAWTCGEMADGTKTWEFDGMAEDGLYIANRAKDEKGKNHYVLYRQ